MAPAAADRAVGIPDSHHCLEAPELKLSAEHFPIPCSLQELVLDRYAGAASPQADSHALSEEEVLEYLKNTTDYTLAPLAAVMAQTEAIGDPAVPSHEHAARLAWLGRAFDLWEREYPLEDPLPERLRTLKPLCAAIALRDPRFLQPGAHPIHQFLDILHARAVGWQPALDRVAAVLEQQIAVAVEHARSWFNNSTLDIANVRDEFSAAIERDQARAARMTQRVIDTERGKVKTQGAKREAVRMLNAAMEKYAVPREIEDFIKGPWYSSAQLLLLKFGADSEQWVRMSETTDMLLDSLQSLEDAPEDRRQYIFQVVTQLPKEMRRWLLSLHHDTEAVNEAMGLVEYTHLRILRRQPVELEYLAPLPVPDGEGKGGTASASAAGDCEEGQWFRIDRDNGETLRVQLALRADEARILLFTNMAGIKVLQASFDEFADLVEAGKVVPIPSGHSFSRSLAKAAGIETTELLETLVEVLGETPVEDSPPAKPQARPEGEPATEPQGETAPKPVTRVADDNPLNLPLVEELEPEALEEFQRALAGTREAPAEARHADAPAPGEQRPATQARVQERDPEALPEGPSDEVVPTSDAEQGYLLQQAQALAGEAPATAPAPAQRADRADAETGPTGAQELEQATSAEPTEPVARDEPLDRQINLTIDTWLGFHDVEVPMMARLAVHDPAEDRYIFVNRKGMKMRELTKAQLLRLIDDGQVDILQRSADFRDRLVDVRRAYDG